MKHYDYLIVGVGLFGSVFAYKTKQQGKKCLVIDRRPHLGGNIIAKRWKVSMCINTVHTSFIPRIRRCGFRQLDCGVQPLYQFARGKLQR